MDPKALNIGTKMETGLLLGVDGLVKLVFISSLSELLMNAVLASDVLAIKHTTRLGKLIIHTVLHPYIRV